MHGPARAATRRGLRQLAGSRPPALLRLQACLGKAAHGAESQASCGPQAWLGKPSALPHGNVPAESSLAAGLQSRLLQASAWQHADSPLAALRRGEHRQAAPACAAHCAAEAARAWPPSPGAADSLQHCSMRQLPPALLPAAAAGALQTWLRQCISAGPGGHCQWQRYSPPLPQLPSACALLDAALAQLEPQPRMQQAQPLHGWPRHDTQQPLHGLQLLCAPPPQPPLPQQRPDRQQPQQPAPLLQDRRHLHSVHSQPDGSPQQRWAADGGVGALPAQRQACSSSSLGAAPLGSLWGGSRGFASAAGEGERSSGPPEQKLRAIPFMASPDDAARAFIAFHSSNPLAQRPATDPDQLKESFLPFWAASLRLRVTVKSAQVGYNHWVRYYDLATRRWSTRVETDWRWALNLNWQFERRYGPEAEAMQVYASHKYPRKDVEKLRPGERIQLAREMTPDMLESAASPRTRRVGPFTMPPAVGLRLALDAARQAERSSAEALLQRHFQADQVRFLDMDVEVMARGASPVYVPAYVFRSVHAGAKLRTFVSAANPAQVAGPRVFDEGKAALAAGVVSGVGLAVTGALRMYPPTALLAWGIALPMMVVGLLARMWPRIRQWWYSRSQAAEAEEAARRAAEEADAWDEEWVRAYSAWEEQQRAREEADERSSARERAEAPRTGDARDPRGYYALLGVSPSASKSEIQAAFRGLALKGHPDRVTGEAEKKRATAAFQRLNEAYSVLRDPAKRRRYDAGEL